AAACVGRAVRCVGGAEGVVGGRRCGGDGGGGLPGDAAMASGRGAVGSGRARGAAAAGGRAFGIGGRAWPGHFGGHGARTGGAGVVWLGVLVAVVRARGRVLDPDGVLRRYRRVALCCWLVLAYSGVVDAVVLIPPGSPVVSGYVLLVAVKAMALFAVGVVGVR